jgi:DNA-binding response OmpR family regulator
MLNYPSQCLVVKSALSRLPASSSKCFEVKDTERAPTALIVDDDPDIAPLVDAAFRPFDIRTEAVSGGADALLHLYTHPYDLVVLDLAMGDVPGFDVLRSLRETRLKTNLPVLVLTADGSHEAIARSFGYGADEFVKKPFDLHELGMRAFRLIYPFRQ